MVGVLGILASVARRLLVEDEFESEEVHVLGLADTGESGLSWGWRNNGSEGR